MTSRYDNDTSTTEEELKNILILGLYDTRLKIKKHFNSGFILVKPAFHEFSNIFSTNIFFKPLKS